MQRRYLYVVVGIIALGASNLFFQRLPHSSTKIPTLKEAARQVEQFIPEQITQIEVDEVLRDRLHLDPPGQQIGAADR